MECGAAAYEARFQGFLAKEFTDPAYGAVHHLTVTAFMLQHSSRLTREGWLFQRELLTDFLIKGQPPEFIRRNNKAYLDSSHRNLKIASKDNKPLLPQVSWTVKITDVDDSGPSTYRCGVRNWANAVLKDAIYLTPSNG